MPDSLYAHADRVTIDLLSVFRDDLFLLGRNIVAMTPREAEALEEQRLQSERDAALEQERAAATEDSDGPGFDVLIPGGPDEALPPEDNEASGDAARPSGDPDPASDP